MPKRRSKIVLQPEPAITATRVSIGEERLVYILVANRKLPYPLGRSRVVYIGTTSKGISRIAQSVAARAEHILSMHGVRTFEVRVITCRRRQRVKMWLKLERALLICFRGRYGSVPKCNTHGSAMREKDELEYFAANRLLSVLHRLA
jgi:hypothetical protein